MTVISKAVIATVLIFMTTSGNAQVLFTYGGHSVSKEEFLRTYNRNTNDQPPSEKSYRDYLELYLRFKLKVQAALDKRMDSLPGQQADLRNFRNQLAEEFMIDDSTLRVLVNEAFDRRKKDIHLAHIFIPFNTPADTLTAFQKATDAYNELKKGTAFGNVARIYSGDAAVQSNLGDIGFITVFTLPYALETLAYTTSTGSVSSPYRSKAGYHIFKNIEERPAAGSMKAAQILLLFPPDASDSLKNITRLKSDSIYKALQRGASFEGLARQYSSDNLTYLAGGEMPVFTVGKYDPAFEKAVFDLPKDGAVTKPVVTKLGYHIIKRIALNAANNDSIATIALLRQQVMNDGRINVARKVIIEKAYRLTGNDPASINEFQLIALYRDSLEKYNPAFANQLQEFKESNLLFEIMQATIWNKPVPEQNSLEEKWIAELKKQYPVRINEDVITSLPLPR